MLWLFKARCNRGHKQCVVVETNKTKVSQSQQCKWELRTAAWQVHVFLPGQKVWNTTFPAKTSAPGTTVWCGYGLPAMGEHQETLHGRVVCTRGDWGTETLSLAFMGAFRPLSLASWALGLGDQTKTTYDFYFLCTAPTSNVEVSTFTFPDTSSVQVRFNSLEENPAQSFFSHHVHLVAQWLIYCSLHPALNTSYKFPHGLFSYSDPHLSASQRLNYLPTFAQVRGRAAGRGPSMGSIHGKAEHHFLLPYLDMLSNAGNQILRGIAFSAFSVLSILLCYECIYNFGGKRVQSCFMNLYAPLFFINLYSALPSLPFSSFFLNTDFFLFLLSSFFSLHLFLSLSFFSSAALPAFHYCHLFSQPLNPWCCSNWQTGFKSTFESACLFK